MTSPRVKPAPSGKKQFMPSRSSPRRASWRELLFAGGCGFKLWVTTTTRHDSHDSMSQFNHPNVLLRVPRLQQHGTPGCDDFDFNKTHRRPLDCRPQQTAPNAALQATSISNPSLQTAFVNAHCTIDMVFVCFLSTNTLSAMENVRPQSSRGCF